MTTKINNIISSYIEEEQELILNLICNIKDDLNLVTDDFFNVKRLVSNNDNFTITIWVKKLNSIFINGIRVYDNINKKLIIEKNYDLNDFKKSYSIAQYLYKKYYID